MKKVIIGILAFLGLTTLTLGASMLGIITSSTWQGDVIAHEYGGLGFDASAIITGGIIRGVSSGTMSILTVGADGLVLTAQADGSVDWETSAGGGGADVKSGTVVSITEDSTSAVTFTSAFTGTPQCVVSFNDSSTEISIPQVESEATTGFTIRIIKVGGGGNTNRGVSWICTDTGN